MALGDVVEIKKSDGSEETLVPFRETPVPAATALRSTIILTSLQTLRSHGYFGRYVKLLADHKAEILDCVAGVWIPMPVARAHYVACDALALTAREQYELGHEVGCQFRDAYLVKRQQAIKDMAARSEKPDERLWMQISRVSYTWDRTVRGGGVSVARLGPKQAQQEYRGLELFDVDYFRHAFRGIVAAYVEPACRRLHVHDMPRDRPGQAIFGLRWV